MSSTPTPQSTPQSYSSDPTLYLYTSLTSGSSHIITATSRLETILKAHKIPFRAVDVATDEKARMLWGRRSKGKKLPGLVRMGMIVGDLEEVEEWNEYGELEDVLADVEGVGSTAVTPSKSTGVGVGATPTKGGTPLKEVTGTGEESDSRTHTPAKGVVPTPLTLALRQAGEEAAAKAGENKEKAKGLKIAKIPPLPEPETPHHSDSTPGEVISSRGRGSVVSPPLEGILTKEEAKKVEDSAIVDPPTQVIDKPTDEEKKLDTLPTPTTDPKPDDTNPASPIQPLSPGLPPAKTTDSTPPLSKHASYTSTSSSTSITHTHHGHTHTHEIPQSPSFSPRASQHRGSSISLASDEEIKAIECAQAILEEDDEGDSDLPPAATTTSKTKSEPSEPIDPANETESAVIESPVDIKGPEGKSLVIAHLQEELGVSPTPSTGEAEAEGKKNLMRSASVDERKTVGEEDRHVSFAKGLGNGQDGEGKKDEKGDKDGEEEKEKGEQDGKEEEGTKEVEKAGVSVGD